MRARQGAWQANEAAAGAFEPGKTGALVVGSGGREHALAWALQRSGLFGRVFCAPGNAGTPNPLPVAATDAAGLVEACRAHGVQFVVVGPEAPLAGGLADRLREAGLAVAGPSAKAARIEASKSFAKVLMERAGVPTAPFRIFYDPDRAEAFVRQAGRPLVVKADGLAAGKGVRVCDTPEQAVAAVRELMVERRLGDAGRMVVIEERLQGEERSLMVVTDGERACLLPLARDYKRLKDGNAGPNTGGMGSVAPVPLQGLPEEWDVERLLAQVVHPVLGALAAEGAPFRGVLYAGLMLTAEGPRVLEFNCRPGDPETQAQVLVSDPRALAQALLAAAGVQGFRLPDDPMALVRAQRASHGGSEGSHACCVVLASHGYPEQPRTGDVIEGLEEAGGLEGVVVFHAGTRRDEAGRVVTAGGRVLNVVGIGDSLQEARRRAYEAVQAIRFAGMQFRSDIGLGL